MRSRVGIVDWPEIPSGTFLSWSGKEIFWNEYMGEVENRNNSMNGLNHI
jgi:hypothetical protein